MKKKWLIFFLSLVMLNSVYARWATQGDAPVETSYVKEFTINSDGTYKKTEEMYRKILTEAGRSNNANITLYYNGDSEKIDILDAKTIYQGKEYRLDNNLIEDKPLASSYNGFDQCRQILIVFPKTEVGATLHLKYKFVQKKPNLSNFFADIFYFYDRGIVTGFHVKIKSKLQLYTLVNDPDSSLKISKNKSANFYNIEMFLNKPIYKDIVDEPGPIIINDKYLTWVSVSSLNKWGEFASKYDKYFAKIFTQELPKNFMLIYELAKKQNSEISQINTVVSLLNNKVRYMGDWRSINGRFMPHNLAQVSQTQLGDCKDFAATTAAILTKLGYKAQIAVVMRGITDLSKNILPSFAAFNHAIVKVTGKQGVTYWIDPTNFESMADGIFPDIANKIAIILDPKEPGYEKIPGTNPIRAEVILKRQLEILSNNKVIENGSLLIRNESTLGLIGSALKVSDDVIKNALFYLLADDVNLDEKNKKTMSLPKLDSRIVKDISLSYSFERETDILNTNVGPALKLTYFDSLAKLYNISQDYKSDILIKDFPSTFKRQTIIKNTDMQNMESLNKEIKTEWLHIKRECSINKQHNIQIDEIIIFYKNLIPSEDVKKPEFIALKNWLKSNFKDVIIVFKPKTQSHEIVKKFMRNLKSFKSS